LKEQNPKSGSNLTETEMLKLIQELKSQKEELKSQNEILQQEKQRLSAILEGTNVGIWEQNISTKEAFYDDRYLEMIGYTLDEISPITFDFWKKFTHPDDVKKSDELLKKHSKGELDFYECEIRMKHKKGNWIWILDRGKITQRDKNGKPIIVSGTHQDITQRKLTEISLRESEEMLKTVFENSAIGIEIFDKNSFLKKSNKKIDELFGTNAEELIDKYNLKNDPNYQYPDVWEQLQNGNQVQHEIELFFDNVQYPTKKSGVAHYSLIATPISDKISESVGYLMQVIDVTQSKQIEEKIRLSQITYRGIFNSISELIYIQDENGCFLDVNEAAEKRYGYDREYFIEKTPEFLSAPGKNDFDKIFKAIQLAWEGEAQNIEFWGITKDGEVFPKEVNLSLGTYFGKKVIITVARDISASKKAEETLAINQKLLKDIIDNSQALIYVFDTEGKLVLINKNFENIFDVQSSSVVNKFRESIMPSRIAEEHRINDLKVIKSGLAMTVEEQNIEPDGIHTYLSVKFPLRNLSNEIYAVGGISIDITDQKLTEIALKESEERYRHIIESANEGISVSQDNNLKFVNQKVKELLGYTEEELLTTPFIEFIHPDYKELIIDNYKKRLNGELIKNSYSVVAIKKDKTLIWLDFSAVKIEWKGKPATMSFITDITERKNAQDALIKSENQYRLLIESANEGILVGQGTHLKFINSKIMEMTGYSEEELLTIPFLEFIHPDSRELLMTNYEKRIKGEQIDNRYQVKIITKDRTIKWTEFSGVKIDWEGEAASMNFITDITERKNTEEALLHTNERNELISNATNDALWDWNFHTNQVWWNKGITELFGYVLENNETSSEWWAENIHPNDKERAEKYYIDIINSDEETWENEYQFKCADGTYAHVFDRGIVKRDNNGKAIRMMGAMMDITKRKIAEKALHESEERYRSLVEWTPEAIIVHKDGKILYINPTALKAVKAESINDFVNKSIFDYIHPESHQIMMEKSKLLVNIGDFTPMTEAKIIGLDGTIIDVETQAISINYNGAQAVQSSIRDITSRKKIEEELKRTKERYKSLVEWTTEAIVVHRDGIILYANAATINAVEATDLQELVGKSMYNFIHPDFHEIIMKRTKELVTIGDFSTILEVQYLKVDGTVIDVETQSIVISYDGEPAIQASIRDITDRKKYEEEIVKAKERYRALVEWSPEPIGVHRDGKILYVNPASLKVLGANSLQELEGKSILRIVHPDSHQMMLNRVKNMMSGQKTVEPSVEQKFIKMDGTVFDVEVQSILIDYEGLPAIQVSVRDISDRKKYEDLIVKAKEQAEESDRLKSAFLANMSHEIRTPMNGILGFTNLLKEANLTPENQQEYIKIIDESGARLLGIINDIIDISKIESNQMMVSYSETNINDKIEYIYNFFKPETSSKGIYLNFKNGLTTNEAFIKTDGEKVYAVLINLVKNAIKFCDKGIIEFGYTLKTNQKKPELEFYVKDSGVGIPKSRQHAIFDRFIQADVSDKRAFQGAGLGLSISKAYVEMLGGKIWVESEVGIGSSFYFTIPYNPISRTETLQEKTLNDKEQEIQVKNLKILIVEDDPISKLLITKALTPFGKEIIKACNGIQAIEACRDNPDIDLVMMDINMPDINGYEATERIRDFNKEVIIIAQTANAFTSDEKEAIAAGCNDYISKPINIAVLKSLLKKHFA